MGREIVLKKIRKSAKALIIMSAIIGTLIGLFAVVLFVVKENEMGFMMTALDSLMVICLVIGIKRYKNPTKTYMLKKNPRLLEMADDLFSDIIYQDKYVIYSSRIIANAKDLSQMAAFEEIKSVTESSSSYNSVSTQHDILISTANYQVRISVLGRKRDTIDELKYDIINRCPNLELKYAQG